MTIETLQALLETSELRADLAEGKVEALRMKVATSLDVINDLRDQIALLMAELADVRELVSVDDPECSQHGVSGCCNVECLTEEDFFDEIVSERTALNSEFSAMVAKYQTRRNSYGLGEE